MPISCICSANTVDIGRELDIWTTKMTRSISYDFNKVDILACDLKGAMIERVHGNQVRIKPRFYRVRDGNLKTRGEWVVQLHEKKVKEFLRNHLDHLVIRRLRTNQPLTDTDGNSLAGDR